CELEQSLVQDRRPERSTRETGERLRRIEGTGAYDVHLRERRARVPLFVQRLGLDQVHLGKTEVREVVRVGAAGRRVGEWRELVEAYPLPFGRLCDVLDLCCEDERFAGSVVDRCARPEDELLPDKPQSRT